MQASHRVRVALGARSYDILIASGGLQTVAPPLAAVVTGRHGALVTNEALHSLYAEPLVEQLRAAGFDITPIRVPDGEAHKSIAHALELVEAFVRQGLDRTSFVIALGGG